MTDLHRPALGVEWQITEYGKGIDSSFLDVLARQTQAEQMIPLTSEVIKSHRVNVIGMVAGELASYAALAADFSLSNMANGSTHQAVELGGAFVTPNFRGNGLATLALEKRVEIMQCDRTAYPPGTYAAVFTNERSRHYVEKANFRPLTPDEVLSEAAFLLCKSCTHCPVTAPKPWQDPRVCCDYDGIRVKQL